MRSGIPVIVFDRRTHSDKYTAYIGANNHEIGASMAEFMANANTAGTKVVELCGLSSSSPAIERGEGFDSVAALRPNIDIVKKVYADWTEEGAYRVMDSLLSTPYPALQRPLRPQRPHGDGGATGGGEARHRP